MDRKTNSEKQKLNDVVGRFCKRKNSMKMAASHIHAFIKDTSQLNEICFQLRKKELLSFTTL